MIDKQKFTKNLTHFTLSPKKINWIIFFIILFVLTALLSSRYYLFQNIIESGISKKDIIATKTIQVIDTEKTEKRKQELAEKVDPILRPAQDAINDYIKRSLGELLSSIKNIRESKASLSVKKDKIKNLLDISEENYFINVSIVYLIKSSEENFSKVASESQNTLERVIQRGISEKELMEKSNEIIDQNINNTLSKTQHHSITLLIKEVLHPNMVIDELATGIAKKNAMNSVEPIQVTFRKGEKIVSIGDLVAKPQKDALRKLGYSTFQLDLKGIIGILLLVGICLYTMAYYLVSFEPKYINPSYLLLISLLAISIVIFAVFLPFNISVYIIPIPAVTILLTIFTNYRISLLATLLIIIMIGVSLQYGIESIAVFILGGLIATFAASLINYYRRMDMVKAGFDVGVIQMLVIFSAYLFQSNLEEISIKIIATDVSIGFINGLGSGIIALGTLPLIESIFKIITPYGLAELADHNQILLRRLQFEAPGTYHHSLMVSNLAEAAAEAIGANPILARVGSFYHDIGKLKRPLFFIENQSYFGIENPHEKLNPRLSKMVITAHPKDGLEIAREYKLPNIINQFIIQHHGDGLAAYFYKQALETEGPENISEEQFRYTGPKPSSKEAAILMLADAVESAVRAVKNPTTVTIGEIIDRIIKERLFDGQLSESPLTQKDLKIIAASFNRILRGMQHHRVKYHENVLEELGQKTNINIQLAQTAKKFEKEFSDENKENKEDKND
ncbi:MAG: HDIG domain-containing metalloprotein [bacterium]